MQSLSDLAVQCPQCRRVLHRTTALYDPNKTAKGNMVELLPKWKKRGWLRFYGGGGNSTPAGSMQCPHCSGRLAPSGKLLIKPDPEPVKTQAQKNQEAINAEFPNEIKTVFSGEETIGLSEFVEREALTCRICGKICKSKLGLGSHMRSHKNG